MSALTWRDVWPQWRDRLLARDDVRRWAEALPLTRWIARRRARQVFDLMAGFVYTQVLLACVRLGLFEHLLAEGPQPLDRLARALDLPEDGCDRLLRAARSLGLLERRSGDRWGLGPLGLPLATDAGLRALVLHHAALYRDLDDPVARLRGDAPPGELARFWPYAGQPGRDGGAQAAGAYSALMAATQPMVAAQVLQAHPVGRHRRLLDVGGGEGAFAEQAAARAPGLQVEVFDLPDVAERARQRLARAGLAGRSRVWPGSFLHDPLPAGADLVTLLRVVHDHDDAAVVQLLRAVRACLAPGGRLLLAEPMAGTPGADAMGDAYFGFYLLAMGQGRPRPVERLEALLHEAGFGRVRRLATRMPMLVQVLVAEVGDAVRTADAQSVGVRSAGVRSAGVAPKAHRSVPIPRENQV
ncbi:methyltransferase [Leptothrix discophora]|uniref:Methyltransferase n=1 Tax=Leptothrix discophora TaxID=89 RepID=A0ABT9G4H4_LEPDI|nr:methyltransferase [Leptothrix discophora]MDP4301396.1 methyltransferase [Leptothrix discophora]